MLPGRLIDFHAFTIIQFIVFAIFIIYPMKISNVSALVSDFSRLCSSRRTARASLMKRHLTTNIFIVGKKNAAEAFVTDGCSEYEKRLTPVMKVTTHFLKSDEALVEAAKGLKGIVYALDENGAEYSSRQFSSLVYKGLEDGGATLSFIIGGFSGLPPVIKQNPEYRFLSLSKMTWTHQMARLLLMEQIYRAVEIRKGTGYHKD